MFKFIGKILAGTVAAAATTYLSAKLLEILSKKTGSSGKK